MDLIKTLTAQYMKPELPAMRVGDTVRVTVRVNEGNRERTQAFEGTIIAKKHGGINETITVRRISYGVGCEKVFPVHSPTIVRRYRSPRQSPQSQAVLPARPRGQESQGQRAYLSGYCKKRGFGLFFCIFRVFLRSGRKRIHTILVAENGSERV